MPKGPQGQKRPADSVARAVMVGRIATGEIEEPAYEASGRKRSGQAGAAARAKALSPEVRSATARAAAKARWKEKRDMTAMTDPLAGLLFGQERTLVNLKLLRGDDPQVSEGDLRAEAHRALSQVLLGNCDTHTDFPEDRAAKRIRISDLAAI
jgi:hypothetical protein